MNPTEVLLTVSAGVTLLTEVLKRTPKIPVNSANAIYVCFVLAVILAFAPALLSGSLASLNAEILAQNVAVIFGAATILYEAVKFLWSKLQPLWKK